LIMVLRADGTVTVTTNSNFNVEKEGAPCLIWKIGWLNKSRLTTFSVLLL